ncbi:MAG: TrkH family potassium uptake protein [Clostridia bacterium]|nr:TrkH family potassium uptake protein [Clostridia bacterium]
MNIKLVLSILGKALLIEGALMIPSMTVSLIYAGSDWMFLAQAAVLVCCVGFILSLIKPADDSIRPREGFVSVALIWVMFSFFGGLPFYFSGYIPSITDCFFETASGFTTTGATILSNVEALPRGLLFWRSFTHWVGGMGVLVLSLALLPHMGARAVHLLKAESTGPAPGKLVPRIGQSAKVLYKLYVMLSVIEAVLLVICGLDVYDALIHTFGTAGTGGFSNYNLSVGHFDNPVVDVVIATFMLLFGVNFSMYFLLIKKKFRDILVNEELKIYFIIVIASVAAICANTLSHMGNFWEALRHSYFQVASIITTTGFATHNFDVWPQFSRVILVILMVIGSCAGSTGGGIKVIRFNLLAKAAKREMRRVARPNSVKVVINENRPVDEGTVSQVAVFFFMYILVIIIATLIVSVDNFDFETSLTAAVATVSNIGPGLGLIGPMGNYAQFSPLSKWTLSFCMLAGRLELYPMLMIFMPSVWRRH